MSARRPHSVLQGLGLWSLLAVVACALPIGASGAEAGAQNPAPVNAFELEAGRRFDLLPNGKDDSTFRLTYKGALVRSEGTPLKFSSGLDLAAPALPGGGAAAAGDRNQWSLKYENRTAALGGSLLQAEGVQPIVFGGVEKLDLRGTAAIATDASGTSISAGLETPPVRIPGLAGREVTNWLVFGVNALRSPAAGKAGPGAGNEDRALVTYRLFVGKAFGWRKSASIAATAQRIEKDVLAQARTLDDAKLIERKIRAAIAAGGDPTFAQTKILAAIDEAEADKDKNKTKEQRWADAVRSAARQIADAEDTRPTVAAYAESSGWYNTGRGSTDGKRTRNLLTATLDYWFLPDRDDTFLRLRYEDGYEWSSPNQRRKQVFLSVSVRI
jgi:hypothetical protein